MPFRANPLLYKIAQYNQNFSNDSTMIKIRIGKEKKIQYVCKTISKTKQNSYYTLEKRISTIG
jgi:hypothetical protein